MAHRFSLLWLLAVHVKIASVVMIDIDLTEQFRVANGIKDVVRNGPSSTKAIKTHEIC